MTKSEAAQELAAEIKSMAESKEIGENIAYENELSFIAWLLLAHHRSSAEDWANDPAKHVKKAPDGHTLTELSDEAANARSRIRRQHGTCAEVIFGRANFIAAGRAGLRLELPYQVRSIDHASFAEQLYTKELSGGQNERKI